jgi:CRISPR-associated endonuclease/helicase Cas3
MPNQRNDAAMNTLSFWGKARPLDPDRGPTWHPLPYHCLDVAAVGEALLTRQRGLRQSLSGLLGLSSEETVSVVCFLLCLHDIGKFAKKFQAKESALYPACFDDDPSRVPAGYDHGAGGLRLFDADDGGLHLPSGSNRRMWRPLVSAVVGHHGAPPQPVFNESLTALRSDFGKSGIEASKAFIQQVRDLFALPQTLPRLERVQRASFTVAGLAVLTDWIGSKQEWFPYCEPAQDLEAYWRHARKQAVHAVDEAGVLPAERNPQFDCGALIDAGTVPTPMQDWARSVELPDGPALFMIEDETGSGKTEAALMLAQRLMASGRADGLYVALPTMATANAMFDRLAAAYRQLFATGAQPSIALAHGARDTHEGFRSAVLAAGRREAPYSSTNNLEEESETTASAACAAWIADDRRRAFLADAGAGTMDQALLSILPSRHQSLRLLGLMRRVLILDEVHAYDAYMQREIERLLEFQAGLGGSAILLSATLPLSVRKRLADAFSKGSGNEAAAHHSVSRDVNYPLATVCGASTQASFKVSGQRGRARTLPVRCLGTPEDALIAVEQAARTGQAVLYIRNTVDDALEAHAALTARGVDADVFHARFALVDRLQIEERVVATFGNFSTSKDRTGKVLIATQVVEQSLDLDFDALITDLAPVDLLIQRAGRLWRHRRPERAGQPELLVVGPDPIADADEKWFSRAFPRAAHVYRDHARLWLTAKVLADTGCIESPDGSRALVEAVYGDDVEAGVPESLQSSFFDAEGRAGAERGVATTNVLDLAKGYVRDGGAWDSDVCTPTRLVDDPQVTLRLARVRNGRIAPCAPVTEPDEPWRAWRLSEVNVAARRVSGEAIPPEYAEAVHATKTAAWTRFDADKILVVLEESEAGDQTLYGTAVSGGETIRLSYSPQRGLTTERKGMSGAKEA